MAKVASTVHTKAESLCLVSVLIYASWSGSLRRGAFIKAGIFILVNIYVYIPIADVYMTDEASVSLIAQTERERQQK